VTTDPVPSSLAVAGFPARVGVGTPGSFTVTARDAGGATLTGYRGTVYLSTTDPRAQIPVSYTFTADDSGTHTFQATLNSLGTQAITATDLADRVRGTQSGILVVPPAPVVTLSPFTPTEGKPFDAAPAFDGTGGRNDYAQVPSALVVGGAITVEAWVKNNNVLAPWARIIDFASGPDTNNIIFGWQGNSGHLYFETHNGTQTNMLVTPDLFPQGQWVHVAAVNDGNGMGFVYINGVPVASGVQMIPATATRTFQYIARSNYGADAFFQGSLQEVQVWTTTRSVTQIQSDMRGLTGAEAGLAAYYPMDEGSGATLFDKTAHHYDATFASTLAGRQPLWVGDSWPGPGKVVATFTGGDSTSRASDFTALITWGDGHTSNGTISPDGHGGFTVTGSNTFAEEGPATPTVRVTDAFQSTGMAQGTATVLDPAVVPRGGFAVLAVAGVASRMQTVATFTDPGGAEAAGDYSAVISWGDNTQSAGTVTGPVGGAFTVQGSHSYAQANSYVVTVTLRHDSAPDAMTSGTALVLAPSFQLVVSGFPSPLTAGNTGRFTVAAQDQLGEPASGYRGTVHFSSSDPLAGLPADYAFTAADGGTRQFDARLVTAGTQSLTATDTANPALAGSQSGVVVRPANHFTVSLSSGQVTAGRAETFTLAILDADGNPVTDYTGTVHFTSSDPQAVLPADYTFTPADRGTHVFGAALRTAGTQTITATDRNFNLITGTSSGITVLPSAVAARFAVGGFPSPVQAGTLADLQVTAYDAYGNVSTGYAGTVTFSSSDRQADLPGDYTFTGSEGGTHTFMVRLKTAGTAMIRVADRANGASGSQGGITVTPGAAASFVLTGITSPVAAGSVVVFTLTAVDAYGNGGAVYVGAVHFSSSDATAYLPADYTFAAGDHGTQTFAVVFNGVGTQTLTAQDTLDPTITGTRGGIVVV
jgi:hypothetical protein